MKESYTIIIDKDETYEIEAINMKAPTATPASAAPGVATDWSKDLGSELDLTLVHKYNPNAKVVFGYSHYWNSALFSALNPAQKQAGAHSNNPGDDSDWAYVMIDTKF